MDLAALVADSFGRLGEALAGMPDDAWSRPSLCEGWQVRHVVAHLTMAARYPAERFQAEMAVDGFDFQRTSDRLALRDGELPPYRLLGDLRSDTMARFEQPEGGLLGSLSHVVIHGWTSPCRSTSGVRAPTTRPGRSSTRSSHPGTGRRSGSSSPIGRWSPPTSTGPSAPSPGPRRRPAS